MLRELTNKKHVALNYVFLAPVDPIAMGIPQYLQIISNPMDLSTIKKKLDLGDYSNGDEFEDDVRLMFNNCYTFNRPEDDVYQLGKRLEGIFDERWSTKPVTPAGGIYKSRNDDSSDEGNQIKISLISRGRKSTNHTASTESSTHVFSTCWAYG